MEHGDGERAAKRAEPSASATADGGGEEDLLSALPDDVLLHILARLRSAAFAARTSALSSRWRRLWALLPTLEFCPLDVYRIGPALAAHEAEARAAVLCLRVFLWEANAASVAAWIPAAARRLSGSLTLVNSVDDWEADGGVFELPCFENATSIRLGLGFLGIAVPASGISARLTYLHMDTFQLQDPCVFGEALSTPHCPSLRRLTVWNARGIDRFTMHSESLLQLKLCDLEDFEQLTLVTPALRELHVSGCFGQFMNPARLVVSISAPELALLEWKDAYDPSSVQLGEMPNLQRLCPGTFLVYRPNDFEPNRNVLRLLGHFRVMHTVALKLFCRPDISHRQYLMESIARLPGNITNLFLDVVSNGHSIGAISFHILRVSTGVRSLTINLIQGGAPPTHCRPGCICDRSQKWKTEELALNHLQQVEILGLTGTEHELAFLEQFFSRATALKVMRISINDAIPDLRAVLLFYMLESISSPKIETKLFLFQGFVKEVLSAPEPEE